MKVLKDNKRQVSGLRKQILNVKGKLWIKAQYIDTNKRIITKLSDASSDNMKRNISLERAVYNSITKGMILCTVENGTSSNLKLYKIIDWGIKYGNKDVTVKRFRRGGKYYTGVWVKGSRGIQNIEKYSYTKKNKLNQSAKENNLVYDNNIWGNEY